jgi:hypothetical protein
MNTSTIGPSFGRGLSIVLLVVGVVALTLGVLASESISSDLSRLFTGRPTDRAIWLVLGGVLTTSVGLAGLLRGSR